MTALALYLPPVLVLVGLSFLLGLAILVTRFADLIASHRPLADYEDFREHAATVAIVRPTRQLANLFEYPVLFYLLVSLAVAAGLRDTLLAELCWLYAGLRCLHAAVHLAYNRLWLRTPVFMAGNLLLLGMWARFVSAVWS